MNLDELTLGQIKQLQGLFGAQSAPNAPAGFVPRRVVVRSHLSGVWFGTLVAKNGTELTLTNARRFYSWSGALTVATIATSGAGSASRLCAPVNTIISDFVEINDASDEAVKALEALPIAK